MSRHGYREIDDYDALAHGRWRAQVASATRGKRGQAFLRELAAAMDAMADRRLIRQELIAADGSCCTIGVVCQSRGIDVSSVDLDDTEAIGDMVGIAHQLAAEIEFENDDGGWYGETPEERWKRMRRWVDDQLRKQRSTKDQTNAG